MCFIWRLAKLEHLLLDQPADVSDLASDAADRIITALRCVKHLLQPKDLAHAQAFTECYDAAQNPSPEQMMHAPVIIMRALYEHDFFSHVIHAYAKVLPTHIDQLHNIVKLEAELAALSDNNNVEQLLAKVLEVAGNLGIYKKTTRDAECVDILDKIVCETADQIATATLKETKAIQAPDWAVTSFYFDYLIKTNITNN